MVHVKNGIHNIRTMKKDIREKSFNMIMIRWMCIRLHITIIAFLNRKYLCSMWWKGKDKRVLLRSVL